LLHISNWLRGYGQLFLDAFLVHSTRFFKREAEKKGSKQFDDLTSLSQQS